MSRDARIVACCLDEFYDSTPSAYPKYVAVLDWARRHGPPVSRQ